MQLIPLPAPQTLIQQEVEFSPLCFHLQGRYCLETYSSIVAWIIPWTEEPGM